jgi:hypothetical protein
MRPDRIVATILAAVTLLIATPEQISGQTQNNSQSTRTNLLPGEEAIARYRLRNGASAEEKILWMNQELGDKILAATADASQPGRQQIPTLLKQRALMLEQVIKEVPAQALGLEVSPEIRGGLAALGDEGGDLLESRGEWSGRLEVVAEDDFQTGASRTVHYLTGTYGALEVHFSGEAPALAAGQTVTVMGVRLGQLAAVSQWRYEGGMRAATVACNTTGEQRIAVLLVSFPTKPLQSTITSDMLRETYFGQGLSLDRYLQESSYGKAWASGQVFGPFVLDADYIGQPTAVRDAAIRAAAGLVDFRNFSRIALVVPQSSTGLISGGMGTMGCSEIPLYPSGSVVASTTWLGDVSLGSKVDRVATASHEMGHNLGLGHAGVADFGDEPLGPVGQLPAPWDQQREYGDSFSNMGRGLGHWSGYHKFILGWLQSGTDVLDVDAGGAYTLRPYEDSVGGIKALRVRRGTGNDTWLWLENRQPQGIFDTSLPDSAFTGAIIHYEDRGWGLIPALLRFNIDTGIFFENAPLVAGANWTDPYSNLTISLNRGAAGRLEVGVLYAAAPVCPGSLNPNKISFDAAGGTANMDVIAPNGCAWTASPSVAWIGINSGTSGSGNGRLSFSVSPSPISGDRWGRIVVGSTTAVVFQKGLAGNATIAPVSANYPETGGTGTILVSTNAPDFAWDFSSNVSWIQSLFCSKRLSIGAATVRYIVAQNIASSPRVGTISIAGHIFTVSQAAGNPKVSKLVWQDLPAQDAPGARHGMASAAMATRGELVLYGGAWNTEIFSDTWVWDGAGWLQKHPVHSPGPRAYSVMTYDVAQGQIVLFGGADPSSNRNDTWIWDGTDWIELHPQNSPPRRYQHAMAYHAASGKIVLFGGFGDEGYLSDTWEWDGSNWAQRISSSIPPSREGHSMTYDAAKSEIVLFGGRRAYLPPVFLSDTWVWDGNAWLQKTTEVSPSPRQGAGMEYHPGLGQVILVGGYGGKDPEPPFYVYDYREETWTWNGTAWVQMYPDKSPEFSWTYAMAYDSARGVLIAHLGDDLHCATRGPKTYVLKAGPGAILLATHNAEFPASGGQGLIAVAASVQWSAKSSDSWITNASGGTDIGSGTGDDILSYLIAPNRSANRRRGTVTIGGATFTATQDGTTGVVFLDVPSAYGFHDYITAIFAAELTNGCASGIFCPENTVTREQMAAFLVRAIEGDRPSSYCLGGSPFNDVSPTSNQCGNIKRLAELGITKVVGYFSPLGLVTCGQMAAFIIRPLYGESFSYSPVPYYSDVPSNNGFFKYVQKLRDTGLTKATGTFFVDRDITRGEMAAFLARAFLKMP